MKEHISDYVLAAVGAVVAVVLLTQCITAIGWAIGTAVL